MRNGLRLGTALAVCLTLAGCSFDKPAIQRRALEVARNLASGNADACLPYADPLTRGPGDIKPKLAFGLTAGLAKAAGVTADNVRIDTVTLADDGKTAAVIVGYKGKDGAWKTLAPQNWVKRDGEWYISF